MKRLTKRQLAKHYKENYDYFQWDTTQVAFELAKDFIYDASLEFEHYINQNYTKFNKKVLDEFHIIWKQAIEETAEYLKPPKKLKSFKEWVKETECPWK